ncbi:hypothetical protein N7510_010284 [Penicillium lagena]|uniref:uncharacterized protein n=1 Tax=Penicillium lagena TaxID=94218 RepID=UPI0025414262|nr:uncharacterized protein N7510_010284 [Penicillium lagena]KAJ5605130.1 hypothetical protein N7510_010284 [Penicillium lagena]
MDEVWELGNKYASEHVQVFTKNPRDALTRMTNFGALFLDILVGKYLKTCTYQEVTSEQASGDLGRLCGRAARAENFEAHARSGDLRAARYMKDEID